MNPRMPTRRKPSATTVARVWAGERGTRAVGPPRVVAPPRMVLMMPPSSVRIGGRLGPPPPRAHARVGGRPLGTSRHEHLEHSPARAHLAVARPPTDRDRPPPGGPVRRCR